MTGDVQGAAFTAFAVFCRAGMAMMLMPGFGSTRVPAPVRLLIAIAVSLALMPLLGGQVAARIASLDDAMRLLVLGNELATGIAMGLMARFFLLALQFSATTTANAIGLAGVPGQPAEDNEALPPLTNLLSLAAVMAVVAARLPEQFLIAVAQSYEALPVRAGLDVPWFMAHVLQTASDTTLLALRLSGPFIAYAVVVNVAMALANKFTPQVSLYFASLGLVTMGGLFLLFLSARQVLHIFVAAFAAWLAGN